MERAIKEQQIAELHGKMKDASIAIIAEFSGIDVATVTDIRKKCRESQVEYKVVKNTLAKRAAQGTSVEKIADGFKGPVVLILGADPVTPAKVIAEFAKGKEEKFKLKMAVVEGKKIDGKGIEALAKMPGINELRGMLVGMINAPASKLARLIATPGQQLARAVGARKEQLEKAS
ncbi:50S ribosomal protein L10 [Vulgatibacter incomptus]|uniref:50S ribosomal protein L10 n=1 Tax=Vulgatibacter incomptus TaxID=1391653 RepID=UPI000680325F|nr:50S ribosomal protein L10 [Vulgatibacter incomptus]